MSQARKSAHHFFVMDGLDTELALFSPTGRRPSSSRFASTGSERVSSSSASELSAPQAPTSKPLLEGTMVKRNRWMAWQPRWATLTNDGRALSLRRAPPAGTAAAA